jgi:hypothetical protein
MSATTVIATPFVSLSCLDYVLAMSDCPAANDLYEAVAACQPLLDSC